jgi:7,8-dihydropterin-6-yl-methyl-4-(beta-D-ribofuranosyl)aminobenzene 5'-phosphate synthase
MPDPTKEVGAASSAGQQKDNEMITITLVYDNYPFAEGMETDWGFSVWIRSGEHNLLFDTGANGGILLRNLEDLGIDPASIQKVMLSHEHGDHIGGLAALISAGADPVTYYPPSFPDGFIKSFQNRIELIEAAPGLEIFEGFYSLGEMPGPPPEQSLVIDTPQGLVVVTGCAHPGIEKILQNAKNQFGKEIYMVIGGFHLGDAGDARLNQIIEDFREIGVKFIAPSHCTGQQQIDHFREAFGEDLIEVGVGKMIEIEL